MHGRNLIGREARIHPAIPFPDSADPRLVVVSNRVADTGHVQTGGLAVAMAEALQASRGLWFGWSGRIADDARDESPRRSAGGACQTLTVGLTPEEHRGYYLGFANGCLWPLLHYRLDLVRIDAEDERLLFAVNARLAVGLARELRPDDRVWVHDYHLLPFGADLRRHLPRARIEFFLHVPLPPAKVFSAAPHHERLGRALFAYDVIGFQTTTDCTNFVRYAVERLGARRLFNNQLSFDGRIVQVGAFPIGIDAGEFAALARDAAERSTLRRFRTLSDRATVAVGVDRLDYSKGLPQRLEAFERLLARSPRHRTAVSLELLERFRRNVAGQTATSKRAVN